MQWFTGDQGGLSCSHAPVVQALDRHPPHKLTSLGKSSNFILQYELRRHRNLEKCTYSTLRILNVSKIQQLRRRDREHIGNVLKLQQP
jgi:hypothetical protein